MELLEEYKAWNNSSISDKQVEYINNLWDSIDTSKKELIIKDEFIINKYLINSSFDLDNIDTSEIFILIHTLKKYAPATFIQMLSVFNIYSKEDVCHILKIPLEKCSILTIKNVELLLGGPDKFKPWIKEHPLICEDEWEYGWQESELCQNNRLEYLKFFNMMMIDIDIDNNIEISNKETLDNLMGLLKKFKNYRFRIYKSYNGYHVFITSTQIKYNDPLVMKLTKMLKGDIFYAMFAEKTGFKIRLSKKINRNEDRLYEYIGDVGNCQEDIICKRLISIHDKYLHIT